jgi:hypothetical protein
MQTAAQTKAFLKSIRGDSAEIPNWFVVPRLESMAAA